MVIYATEHMPIIGESSPLEGRSGMPRPPGEGREEGYAFLALAGLVQAPASDGRRSVQNVVLRNA